MNDRNPTDMVKFIISLAPADYKEHTHTFQTRPH